MAGLSDLEKVLEYMDAEKLAADEQDVENLLAGVSTEIDPRPVMPKFRSLTWYPEQMQNSYGFIKIAEFMHEQNEEFSRRNNLLRLRRVLYPSEQSAKLLSATCADNGHPYESELSSYAVSMLSLPRQLALYRSVAGTDNWFKFVEFFFGAEIRCDYLYTDNYRQFSATPRGALVSKGGTWYKTTHVNLVVNIRQLRFNLKPRSNQTLYARTLELLEQYLPVTLIVNKLTLLEQISSESLPLTLYSAIKVSKVSRCKPNTLQPKTFEGA